MVGIQNLLSLHLMKRDPHYGDICGLRALNMLWLDVSLVSRLWKEKNGLELTTCASITFPKIPVLKLLFKNQYNYVRYISTSLKDRCLVGIEITFNPTEMRIVTMYTKAKMLSCGYWLVFCKSVYYIQCAAICPWELCYVYYSRWKLCTNVYR